MVCFDLLMEPAAVKLDYWTWLNGHIHLRNYLVWFGLEFHLCDNRFTSRRGSSTIASNRLSLLLCATLIFWIG